MASEYIVAGLMSGTSLDGLDVAICRFSFQQSWSFEILAATTFDYSADWKKKLAEAHLAGGLELAYLNTELGALHGKLVRQFIETSEIKVDFISSHGHTVFHQPNHGMTLQIGSAPHIVAATQLPVIADFRTTDVALGGQGAPLVPIGDLLLFNEFALCLNLGGIANISVKTSNNSSIKAFDVCPCNMVLNHFAAQLGHDYDRGGALASTGEINTSLLEKLNNISFYKITSPKSLGKEFFDAEIFPLLKSFDISAQDHLRTFVEHIAQQLAQVTDKFSKQRLLITGGGAFNTFLIDRIKSLCDLQIVIPDNNTIQFKEALIFAFLGVLRMREENNSLQAVTGARKDHSGGVIYLA